jgi:two-component system, chemotaxis family, protein-glutamate methylesterase/glutaminase
MSPPIRVLIVDDARFVRRAVTEELAKDPAFEVVGAAEDGHEGLELMRLSPDVVVLDIEMPRLDGLQMLKELRRRGFTTAVIMFTSVTAHTAGATLRALTTGADDYVTKPRSGEGGIRQAVVELAERLKLLGRPGARVSESGSDSTLRRAYVLQPALLQPPGIVVVAASTGGPVALGRFVAGLPAGLPAPVVVVQHMPDPMFTEALCVTLGRASRLPVAHAKPGRRLVPGQVVVAPGGTHVLLEAAPKGAMLRFSSSAPVNGVRPAADPLFSSAAKLYGSRVLAVVLTGMGQDGLHGAQEIVEHGGAVVVQDEATSTVWGMPGCIAKAGLASLIAPPDELAFNVERRCRGARGASS